MTTHLAAEQLAALRTALRERAVQLREEIRQALLRSDSEHYLQIADSVRDLEDESFADLIVDVGLAEIDRDLQELRAIEAAQSRVAVAGPALPARRKHCPRFARHQYGNGAGRTVKPAHSPRTSARRRCHNRHQESGHRRGYCGGSPGFRGGNRDGG